MTYKQTHELFVSGHNGTTVPHISAAVASSMLPVYFRDLVAFFMATSSFIPGRRFVFAMDFILTILPLQVFMSVLGDYSEYCLLTTLTVCVATCYICLKERKTGPVSQGTKLLDIPMGNKRAFITYYRAYVNLLTAFSILAVDFKIFPRYFAKAETYGTGLMDVGVGCYLISNAIVSPEAKGRISLDSPAKSIMKSIKSSLPLLVLGTCRLVAIKFANYQEHVTEYGIHWNFFFTLAAVKIMCTILFCWVPPRFWNIIGVVIIALYQHNLTYGGLREYVINGLDGRGGRHGIIDSNREGLISCIGFLCIYVMGIQLGKIVMRHRKTVSDWFKGAIHITIVTIGSWVLLLCSEKYIEPVSRRFANLSYLLWMLMFNSLLLLVMLVGDITVTCVHYLSCQTDQRDANKSSTDPKIPGPKDQVEELEYPECPLMSAINYNGLFYFLSANILTGLINLCIRTIYQPPIVAFLILTVYMLTLSLVICFLFNKRISLKVW